MALDPVKNFSKATVSTGYDASATSIVLSSGHGANFPQPSTAGAFNVTWWNSTDYPDPSDDPNVEIVRVTARSTDTLTVTRAQENTSGTTKNTGGKTYKMILGPTAKTITDVAASVQKTVNQTTHGLSVGDVIKSNGTANQYSKAQADSAANAEVVGIVTLVPDADNFVFTTGGEITSGVPAVAAGTTLFLDPSTAGALTSTEPTTIGQISKPVAVVVENGVRMFMSNKTGVAVVAAAATIPEVQSGQYVYAADGGGSDTYVITLSPALTAYTTGQVIVFKANTANTGAATLNVNSLGAKTIKKNHDVDLADNDIEANQLVVVVYDGTNFEMVSQVANSGLSAGSATYVGSPNTVSNTASTSGNIDTDYTTNFQSKTVMLYYKLHGKQSGSEAYSSGVAIYNGTSLTMHHVYFSNTLVGTTTLTPNHFSVGSSAPTAGDAGSNINVTLSLQTVNATKVTVRFTWNAINASQSGDATFSIVALP